MKQSTAEERKPAIERMLPKDAVVRVKDTEPDPLTTQYVIQVWKKSSNQLADHEFQKLITGFASKHDLHFTVHDETPPESQGGVHGYFELDDGETQTIESVAGFFSECNGTPSLWLRTAADELTNAVEILARPEWSFQLEEYNRDRKIQYRFDNATSTLHADKDETRDMIEFAFAPDGKPGLGDRWTEKTSFVTVTAGDFSIQDLKVGNPSTDPDSFDGWKDWVDLPYYTYMRGVSVTGPFATPTIVPVLADLNSALDTALERTVSAAKLNKQIQRVGALVPWDDWESVTAEDIISRADPSDVPEVASDPLRNIDGVGAKNQEILAEGMGTYHIVASADVDDIPPMNGVSDAGKQRIIDGASLLTEMYDILYLDDSWPIEDIYTGNLSEYPKPHPPSSAFRPVGAEPDHPTFVVK